MVMGTNIIKIKFKKINEIKVLPFFFLVCMTAFQSMRCLGVSINTHQDFYILLWPITGTLQKSFNIVI